ncbi:MAG TPA: DPP IV N-terminal domain-containing protein [Planctomycetota bacterium]|nr:DPP IV N-terminal domain-containing protein [Planctomycetota bacterium]OQC20475.1 MAG: Prolyl tripeptidyl peptidase precursor [Planctomycetes bacterium ADurb.Bin069]HNR99053.1 DPP IV N-terminal domain-containing protein [Planctomycetota bacterium]HNU26254.1 DPP IV N-terminal domain-containing protein [Planctomycetota bacterium]HOE30771.1 DPP IV N-terminal domain-containing protein [Planctomycetota bacterium]
MAPMVRHCILFAILAGAAPGIRAEPPAAPRLTAEPSGRAAATADIPVEEFARALAQSSPNVRQARLGVTGEGRAIPLILFADPPVATAEEAARSGKLLVLLLGGLRGGDTGGKDAFQALLSDLARDCPAQIRERLIIAAAPVLNTDEEVAAAGRPGPEGGAHANAQPPDRDFVRLETPEARALARFLTAWNPAVVIEARATDGGRRRHPLAYAGLEHPAADPYLAAFARDSLLPAVAAALRAEKGIEAVRRGGAPREGAGRRALRPLSSRGTAYAGLRNSLAILTEASTRAPRELRARAVREFVRATLAHAAERADEIRRLIAAADRAVIAAGREPESGKRPIPLRARPAAAPAEGAREDRLEPEVAVERAYAYLLPAAYTSAAEILMRHGIDVEELREEEVELDVQAYTVTSVAREERRGPDRAAARVAAERRAVSRRVDAGTFLVRSGQKLGTLAALLLEPASENGLAARGCFDAALEPGAEFPVARLAAPAPLLLCGARPPTDMQAPPKPLTFKELYESDQPPRLGGTHASGMRWLRDGEHYLHAREGNLWKIQAATGRAVPFPDRRAMAEALARLPWIGRRDAENLAGRTNLSLDPPERGALFDFGGDLYYCDLAGAKAVRLTSFPGEKEFPEFSPDGSFVAFVSENDLWLVDIATQTPRRLTTGGHAKLRNGKADWVYYEEVFHRVWKAFWWSPDSRRLAFLQIDSSPAAEFVIANDLESRQAVECEAFPKPGEPAPRARVGIVDVAGSPPRWADLSAYDPADILVAGAAWSRGGDRLYFYVQNRVQTWLDICAAPPAGGATARVLRDATAAWIEPPRALRFLADGSFLLTSERSGWQHIYHHGPDGALRKAVTAGPWEVRDVLHVDETGGWVYFTGTRDSHIAHNLYRAALDGSAIERLTPAPGHHTIGMSPTGGCFLDTWSTHARPEQVVLRRSNGARVRTIDANPLHEAARYRLGAVALHTIEAPGGFQLEAMLVTPHDFDPERKYPVWFSTYAGPHSQTVWDSWGGGRAWERMLAEAGIISFLCDPRSASGKGAVSAWIAYRRLGQEELKDIESALDWLSARPFVDSARIGISGFSYGGFMAAYALTHSKRFAAGIAGAAVTDWRDYDSIYTERYMGTPQDNPDGYAAASVVAAAANLHGRLLIMHGGLDDNVHAQHATRLVHALQQAGKRFDLMLYPEARHGIWGLHYRRVLYEFIRSAARGADARDGAQWRLE